MQLISDGGAVPSARDLGLSESNERPVIDAAKTPPYPLDIPVLYEDEVLLVVNKPAGLATQPRGSFVARSVVAQLRWARRDPQLIAAHRLDRLTSGVLVLVKQPEWRGTVQAAFENRTPGLQKNYVARTTATFTRSIFTDAAARHWAAGADAAAPVLAPATAEAASAASVAPVAAEQHPALRQQFGNPGIPGEPFEVELPLLKTRGVLQVRITEEGRPTRTHLRVTGGGSEDSGSGGSIIGSSGGYLDWELAPHSGYTHQLRVTLAALGYPILGDPLYPEITAAYVGEAAEEQLHLHAQSLTLPEDLGGMRWPRFEAPRPW